MLLDAAALSQGYQQRYWRSSVEAVHLAVAKIMLQQLSHIHLLAVGNTMKSGRQCLALLRDRPARSRESPRRSAGTGRRQTGWSHDFHWLSCPFPGGIRQCCDPLLGYALYFCCHARSSLLCIEVFSLKWRTKKYLRVTEV